MSTKELRDKAHQAVDAIPDDKLERFVAILSEVQQILRDAEFDARVKRILDENRGLMQRLA
ncbi:MAG: hypothetical protein WAT74_00710 [Flavobacteriales bacterium]